MGQRPQKTAWLGYSIRRSLGEYKDLPEKFRLEMLALSLLNLYSGECGPEAKRRDGWIALRRDRHIPAAFTNQKDHP